MLMISFDLFIYLIFRTNVQFRTVIQNKYTVTGRYSMYGEWEIDDAGTVFCIVNLAIKCFKYRLLIYN